LAVCKRDIPPKDLGFKIDLDKKKKKEWLKAFRRVLAELMLLGDRWAIDQEAEESMQAVQVAIEETMPKHKPFSLGFHPY
jgi:hypothetical protein